jgi:hypothetical protein
MHVSALYREKIVVQTNNSVICLCRVEKKLGMPYMQMTECSATAGHDTVPD